MFDRLVALAKDYGNGDLLKGLEYLLDNIEDEDEDIQRQFRTFMRMGAQMFAPVDA
jgi:hypothetical protein